MSFPRSSIHGFTLVDMLVAVLIASVVLGIGVPTFGDLMQRTAQATAYHRLTAAIMQARSTAITRRTRVALCPSADGTTCSNGQDWSTGWILYQDPDNAGQPAQADDVIGVFDRLPGGLAARSSMGRPRVRYLPDGRSPGSNLSIELCNADGMRIGRVIVNNAGRVRSEKSRKPEPCSEPMIEA